MTTKYDQLWSSVQISLVALVTHRSLELLLRVLYQGARLYG